MRIAIVGAGAIGCTLATRLSEHGHAVTLVGRAAQVETIRRDGLRVRGPGGDVRRYDLPAVTALTEPPELVLLTVKTQDLAQACRELVPARGDAPVVAMQNGLDADRIAGEILGRDNVLGAVIMTAADYLAPGELSILFLGWILLGEPFGPLRPRTREIAAVLRQAMPTFVTTNVPRARWTKLISNLNNGICAATGLTMPQLPHTAEGRALTVRVMKEGYRVARKSGIRLDIGLYGLSPSALRTDRRAAMIAVLQSTLTAVLALAPDRVAERVLALAAKSALNQLPIHGSTWQSIQRGKPTEIDYLNGAVVRQGRLLGIPTPYNSRIVEVVHAIERDQTFRPLSALMPASAAEPAPATTPPRGSV